MTDDFRHGQQIGVRGTPSLYLDGKKIQNRSIEGISAMIEASLKAKKDGDEG